MNYILVYFTDKKMTKNATKNGNCLNPLIIIINIIIIIVSINDIECFHLLCGNNYPS